jgi:hypothetical protein
VGPARRSLDTVSTRPEISGHPFIARSHGFEPNSGNRGRMDCLLRRSVAPLFWLITAKVRRTAKPHLEHIQVDIYNESKATDCGQLGEPDDHLAKIKIATNSMVE